MQATVRPVVEVRLRSARRSARQTKRADAAPGVVRAAGPPVSTGRALRDAVAAMFGVVRV